MLSFQNMPSRSLKNWFESGMNPDDFPEIPSDTTKRDEFLGDLMLRLASLPDYEMINAVGRIPGILADRIPVEEIIDAVDAIEIDDLSPHKSILLGELALDFLILDEKWSECIPRIDSLISIACDAGLTEELAILYNYRGVCLYRMARYPEARADLEESLRYADEADSDLRRARAQSNLGLVMKEMGRLDDAAGHYKSALSLARDIGDDRSVRAIYLNIGNIYKELGRWDDGIRALEKGIEVARKLGEVREEIRGRLNLGVLLLEKGDSYEDALALFEGVINEAGKVGADQLAAIARENAALALVRLGRADESLEYSHRTLDEAEAENDVEGIWRSLANMGRAHSKLGRIESADTSFKKALDEFSKLRGTLVSDRDRSEYQRNLRDLQAEYIEHSIANHPPEIAFARLARAKSRALLQTRDTASPAPSREYREEEILEKIQNRLSEKPRTALVDYFFTSSGLRIFVCDEKSVTSHESDISERDIEPLVGELTREINLFIASREYREAQWDVDSEIPAELVELGEMLYKPLEKRLSGLDELVIVPHGILHRIPFAALGIEDGKYLIEKHALRFLPSSDFIIEEKPVTSPEHRTLVLKSGGEDLAGVKREIETLREIVGDALTVADPGEILRSKGIDGLGAMMSEASAVHFAGHAEFDRSDPYSSALMLDDGTGISVGDLSAAGMNLSATRLVSLAGCETGMGKILAGDEVIGIARAFLAAGAATVLVSLWKVSDDATAEIMPHFYREWLAGSLPSHALRQSVQAIMAENRRHPYFFAPFRLIGG